MIDLSAAQVAEHLQAILDLRSDLRTTTFDFREEAPAYIDSTRMYKALNIQDYIRALQLGGYGYTVVVNFGAIASGNSMPLSIFNNGSKSYLIYSIMCASVGAVCRFETHAVGSDPLYTSIAIPYNRKVDPASSGGANLSTTFVAANTAIPATSPMLEGIAAGNGTTFDILDNNEIYVLPAGTKSGIVTWAIASGAVTQAYIHVSMVELPF